MQKLTMLILRPFSSLLLGFLVSCTLIAGLFLFEISYIIFPAYLSLHIIIELFSIVISFMIFAFCWGLREKNNSKHLLILGITFLIVGIFDFIHLLSYRGMPDFLTPSGVEKAIYFWLAGRFSQATGLLLLILTKDKPNSSHRTFSILSILAIITTAITSHVFIYHSNLVPQVFIPGQGLTSFKIIFEGFILFIFITTAILIIREFLQDQLGFEKSKSYVLTALLYAILSEVCFSLYKSHDDLTNVAGHILKVISFSFLYTGLLKREIILPYTNLALAQKELLLGEQNLMSMKSELVRAEKFATLGSLMATVAHNLGNVLMIIKGNLDFIARYHTDHDIQSLKSKTDQIDTSLEQGRRLISSLIDFSKNTDTNREKIFLSEMITASAGFFSPLMKDIEFKTESDPDLAILASKADIEQILMNLVINARDAISPQAGTIEINAKSVSIENDFESLQGRVPVGKYCRLTVKDSGVGILPDDLPNIFKPFFTTKPKGSGTGLGLPSVLNIVKKLGGHIDIKSTPKVCTEFIIYFPVA